MKSAPIVYPPKIIVSLSFHFRLGHFSSYINAHTHMLCAQYLNRINFFVYLYPPINDEKVLPLQVYSYKRYIICFFWSFSNLNSFFFGYFFFFHILDFLLKTFNRIQYTLKVQFNSCLCLFKTQTKHAIAFGYFDIFPWNFT